MIEEISKIIKQAFNNIKIDIESVRIIKSNRPDLCDFQCDDLFKLSKIYKKNPMEIGDELINYLDNLEDYNNVFKKVEVYKPGFINIIVSDKLINKYIKKMINDISYDISKSNETYVIDFGGANIAKPLHVGHMRTILVGESISRILKFKGNKVITDVHLGDYGLQIGEVIYKILEDKISIDDINIKYLEKAYPLMNQIIKENEVIKNECAEITKELQNGNLEYKKIFNKIKEVSINDIKKNYDFLGANFTYWYGESDSYKYLSELTDILNKKNLLYESEGALVIDVKEDTDKIEMPPLLYKKSNGAYLYASTDLATILQRKKDFNPDHILYVVDNRQSLHFNQVFRASSKAGIMDISSLEHLSYGTVNGTDGKPYKTRSGETPKLEDLFNDARNLFISKKETNKDMDKEDIDKIVNSILKFADLMNSREKDYIFDLNKFSDISGKTGPYILYTYLRNNKIIDNNLDEISDIIYNDIDRNLRLAILSMKDYVDLSYTERMPSFIAEYVYNLCVLSNNFYQNNRINNIEDLVKKNDYMCILSLTNKVIKTMLYLLGIDIPKIM